MKIKERTRSPGPITTAAGLAAAVTAVPPIGPPATPPIAPPTGPPLPGTVTTNDGRHTTGTVLGETAPSPRPVFPTTRWSTGLVCGNTTACVACRHHLSGTLFTTHWAPHLPGTCSCTLGTALSSCMIAFRQCHHPSPQCLARYQDG